jgi:hypothetical protein
VLLVVAAPASPVVAPSLADYFRQRLTAHAQRLRPPPQEDTCWYLGSLLERFGRSDRLFAYASGRMTLKPLAELYGDALEANTERERCLLLQHLGDLALFLGALFPERFERRGISRDYFVGMGGGAYDYLADNAPRNGHIFAELAATFTRMLDMVANACARRREAPDAEELLALYRKWIAEPDRATEARLRAHGIDLHAARRLH